MHPVLPVTTENDIVTNKTETRLVIISTASAPVPIVEGTGSSFRQARHQVLTSVQVGKDCQSLLSTCADRESGKMA